VVAWEFLALRIPYPHMRSPQIIQFVLDGGRLMIPQQTQDKEFPSTPPPFREVIERCWHHKQPRRLRFSQTCAVLKQMIVDTNREVCCCRSQCGNVLVLVLVFGVYFLLCLLVPVGILHLLVSYSGGLPVYLSLYVPISLSLSLSIYPCTHLPVYSSLGAHLCLCLSPFTCTFSVSTCYCLLSGY
jgi:hypothetical protein